MKNQGAILPYSEHTTSCLCHFQKQRLVYLLRKNFVFLDHLFQVALKICNEKGIKNKTKQEYEDEI